MPMKTYPMKVEDGKVYAVVTLRDVVERCDVSDLPMLAEVKRLYDENVKLQELAKQMHVCLTRPKVYDGEHPYLTATECPYFTEGTCDYNACGFERRMRELGIEVPDGEV